MIRTFRHRGLKRLYEKGDSSHVSGELLNRIEDILARLDVAITPPDLDLPGYGLHQLKGKLKGCWALKVSGNWRIIFRFKDGDAYEINLVDYH